LTAPLPLEIDRKGVIPALNSAEGEADKRITCPKCGSDAYYKYGKTKAGKARYLCLSCNRQFVACPMRKVNEKRPPCPGCGKPMHVYMRFANYTRFRCMDYPECRTFLKV
jgi:ssDNA-binding Zn-finger/Zn-ribbon topoisomerase 1